MEVEALADSIAAALKAQLPRAMAEQIFPLTGTIARIAANEALRHVPANVLANGIEYQFVSVHHRMTDSISFGPFDTLDAALAFPTGAIFPILNPATCLDADGKIKQAVWETSAWDVAREHDSEVQ